MNVETFTEDNMTRKQALNSAIQILSTNPEYKEISNTLQEIRDELPLVHWSDKSIHDAVKQFIVDNERVPTSRDFDKQGLPPHTVIKQKYKVNLSEWLHTNYPIAERSFDERVAPYIKVFIDEYNRIQPKTQKDFEKNRRSGVVCYQTIMKYCHVSTWEDVIKTLDLVDYRRSSRAARHIVAKVQIHADIDQLL